MIIIYGKTALLIIDMQNDFCLPGAPFEVAGAGGVIPFIQKALVACRENGMPIVHIFRHYRADGSDVEITRYDKFMQAGGGCVEGTEGAKIIEQLKPVSGDYLVVKQRWSAFFQTELDGLLRRLGVEQVVIAGVQTPNCIRGTVWDANSLDYEVIVLTDGTGAETKAVHQGNLLDMKNVGIKLMTTAEFISLLPDVPTHNLRRKIQVEIEKNRSKCLI